MPTGAEDGVDSDNFEPLGRHPAMRTTDADEAEEIVSRAYVTHQLRVRGALDARLNLARGSDRLTFGLLSYGGRVDMHVPPMIESYHLNLTLAGSTRVRHGSDVTTTDARAAGVLLSPHEESELTWSPDSCQFAVKIRADSLSAQLSRLLDQPVDAPRLGLHVDLAGPRGQCLLKAAMFLAEQLDGGQVGELAREQLESYLLTQLLLTADHPYSARLHGQPSPLAGRRLLDDLLDLVEAHPERVLGLAELAATAGLTAPALQALCRRELGTDIEAYVREVRLRRIHAELSAHDAPDPFDVVAHRWGLLDTRRARAEYEVRFGPAPVRTSVSSPLSR